MCLCMALVCTLFACNQTDEMNREVENQPAKIQSARSSVSSSELSNALWFDSIAQANALLQEMQSIDNADFFYNTYITNFSITNKYLNSIYEYLCLLERIENGDTEENIFESINQLKDSLLSVNIDLSEPTIEPLSVYDYRCLVNEDAIFVVADEVYCLFDSVFVICPINKYDELRNITSNSYQAQQYIASLMGTSNLIQSRERNPNDDIYDLDYVYIPTGNGIHDLNYEKIVDNHRMRVSISASENHVAFYNRHDLKTEYSIKSHNKWAGTWWIKKEETHIDIFYIVRYFGGSTPTITIDHNYSLTESYPSYSTTRSYPETNLGITSYGIEDVNFNISNQYMTITKYDIITE